VAPIADRLTSDLRSSVRHEMPSDYDSAHRVSTDSFDAWPSLITSHALAALLNVSVRTLERRRLRGDFIPFRTVGRRILYAKSDVVAYLDAMRFTSTAASRMHTRQRF
jgi:hypothetical protein